VSRGQLVEIGGAFRVPEVMAQSGAVLKEVGTTNKTRIGDYHHAIGPETAALMKVHTSNFRVMGFTEETGLEELVELARNHNLWVIEDLGSGFLLDTGVPGIDEPTVADAIAAGADVVTFSGDKLLGGPQAGIIAGRLAAVETLARHPLMRALRPDKVTLAALEATLKLYRDPRKARSRVPTLAMLSAAPEKLNERAVELADKISGALGGGFNVQVLPDNSEAGGGSLPLTKFPTFVVSVSRDGAGVTSAEAALRRFDPPVIARIREDALILDPRTIPDAEFDTVARSVAAAFQAE
jgi:L-seryl-tRNA(Ser) seleniumtransferase